MATQAALSADGQERGILARSAPWLLAPSPSEGGESALLPLAQEGAIFTVHGMLPREVERVVLEKGKRRAGPEHFAVPRAFNMTFERVLKHLSTGHGECDGVKGMMQSCSWHASNLRYLLAHHWFTKVIKGKALQRIANMDAMPLAVTRFFHLFALMKAMVVSDLDWFWMMHVKDEYFSHLLKEMVEAMEALLLDDEVQAALRAPGSELEDQLRLVRTDLDRIGAHINAELRRQSENAPADRRVAWHFLAPPEACGEKQRGAPVLQKKKRARR